MPWVIARNLAWSCLWLSTYISDGLHEAHGLVPVDYAIVGKKLIVLLRDGRKLLGTLCSFDQFANVVLQGACERVIVGELYCDVPLGLYVIRGENVVLIGELDREKDELPAHMTCVSEADIRMAEKAEREARDLKGTMRKRMEFLDFD